MCQSFLNFKILDIFYIPVNLFCHVFDLGSMWLKTVRHIQLNNSASEYRYISFLIVDGLFKLHSCITYCIRFL